MELVAGEWDVETGGAEMGPEQPLRTERFISQKIAMHESDSQKFKARADRSKFKNYYSCISIMPELFNFFEANSNRAENRRERAFVSSP